MKIFTIPQDFIINASHESGGMVISNFLLHGLNIENDHDESVMLKSLNFELYSSEDFVKQTTFTGKALEKLMMESQPTAKRLNRGFGAKLYLGREGFFDPEKHEASFDMKPGQQRGLFNEYFIVIHSKVIDRMTIRVEYDRDGKQCEQQLDMPLIKYQNKNKYIFPLKGNISTCGNYNSLPEHRQHYSMEFAFDMAQYNTEQKLFFKEDMKETDHVIFGKEVLAIADGEVVDCYDDFNMTTSWNWEERRPLIEKYGLAAQCGNHVVLKHENGEYSFYGHLVVNSLTIKTGDRVTQGQPIGKVGNTGLSNCPHLHFQLMDGPDFMSSRGLPCAFVNIKDVAGNELGFIQEENIIVHAE